MRKNFKIILFSCLVGSVLAGLFFLNVKEKAEAKNKNIIYAFQVGVFKNKENASNLQAKYGLTKVVKEEDYYRVFLAVTVKNKDLLEQKYIEKGYNFFIKEIEVTDEYLTKILKYDDLYQKTTPQNQELVLKSIIESLPNEL